MLNTGLHIKSHLPHENLFNSFSLLINWQINISYCWFYWGFLMLDCSELRKSICVDRVCFWLMSWNAKRRLKIDWLATLQWLDSLMRAEWFHSGNASPGPPPIGWLDGQDVRLGKIIQCQTGTNRQW